MRVAQARIAAGQSELTLVGGAYHGTALGRSALIRAPDSALKGNTLRLSGIAVRRAASRLATMGAFLVLESREHAQARGARPRARISAVCSDRNLRQPGDIEASLRAAMGGDRRLGSSTPTQRVISGAAGLEPATSAELSVLKEIGLPVRNAGTYIGHGVDTQFAANIGIACAALEHGKLFAPGGKRRQRHKSAVDLSPGRRHQRRQLARRRARADNASRMKEGFMAGPTTAIRQAVRSSPSPAWALSPRSASASPTIGRN